MTAGQAIWHAGETVRGPLDIDGKVEIPESDLTYEYARSGGPGGQHVNTTDSRARLRFDLEGTTALTDDVKARLRANRGGWLTSDGALVITADSHRSQHKNTETVRERLAEAIAEALVPPKTRKKTRPSRRAKARRVDEKRRRGDLKSSRKKVDGSDQ